MGQSPIPQSDRFNYERRLFEQGARCVAGIDEVGRGPLAGPVVAAAVILPKNFTHDSLNDSKQLKPDLREQIYGELIHRKDVFWSVGIVDHEDIDRHNIALATYMAMKSAVQGLSQTPDFLLIDGHSVPLFSHLRQLALVKGDSKSFSIAAASVIAKVTRDRLMLEYHQTYPQYNFQKHKGYGTREHLDALSKYGPCPIHRKSFFPIRREPQTNELPFD
jgi:ribonuclease HII